MRKSCLRNDSIRMQQRQREELKRMREHDKQKEKIKLAGGKEVGER